jgi:hypothetical protein
LRGTLTHWQRKTADFYCQRYSHELHTKSFVCRKQITDLWCDRRMTLTHIPYRLLVVIILKSGLKTNNPWCHHWTHHGHRLTCLLHGTASVISTSIEMKSFTTYIPRKTCQISIFCSRSLVVERWLSDW